jgi:hypothetical protein
MRAAIASLVLILAACVTPATAQEDDPVAPIAAFHAALAANDPEAAAAQLGPSLFIADESSTRQSDRVRAHLFLSGERLSSWPQRYLAEVGPHRNAFTIVSVSIRGNAAVVVTRDTGSNGFRAWRDEETTWFLGREESGWRIAAYVIRDFQPPAAQ